MCVLVIVDAKSKRNFKCGLSAVWIRSLFSAGQTGEDHNKVNKWEKETDVTRPLFLGQYNMLFPCVESM